MGGLFMRYLLAFFLGGLLSQVTITGNRRETLWRPAVTPV